MTTHRYLADIAVTCDQDFSVVSNAAIDVTDGRISFIGPRSEAPPCDGPVHHVGGLIMPGLVNSHAHTPMTLVRGAGDGPQRPTPISPGFFGQHPGVESPGHELPVSALVLVSPSHSQ